MAPDKQGVLDRNPLAYWRVRYREINRSLTLLSESVADVESQTRSLIELAATAKSFDPVWEQAKSKGMKALRQARSHRTHLRNLVANVDDTLRIRKHLADEYPEALKELVDKCRTLISLLEVRGY